MIIYKEFENVYQEILKLNNKFGVNKKVETHLHTPASYDYKLIESESSDYYKRITDKEILDLMLSKNYINDYIYNNLLQLCEDDGFLNNYPIFKSYKEMFSYMIVYFSLLQNEIEVTIVCDHHTIDGWERIKVARDIIISTLKNRKFIHIFCGVEISCADKNHVIGIIDPNNKDKLKKYLTDTINSKTEGTYKTAHDVLHELKEKCDAITYIAHIDTKDEVFNSSGAYKNILFSSNLTSVYGLSNMEREDLYVKKIHKYTNQKLKFIHDGDSHGIDTIGSKSIWIKMEKVNYTTLKKAFINFNTCISNVLPNKNENYIKGIYIKSDDGFLKEKESDIFKMNFSPDLNCVIGGRGTGKSTILKIIELGFSLFVDNIGSLKVISKHDTIYIVFYINGDDYILIIEPQVEFYRGKMLFADRDLNGRDDRDRNIKLNEFWRKLYKVVYNEKEKRNNYILQEDMKLAEKFFTRTYSINQLISKIQSKEISGTLKDIIINNIELEKIEKTNLKSNASNIEIINEIKRIALNMHKNNIKIARIVNKFNKENEKVFKICHDKQVNLKNYSLIYSLENENWDFLNDTVVTVNDLTRLMHLQIKEIGILNYLFFIFSKDYDSLEKKVKVQSVERLLTKEEIDSGKRHIKDKDVIKIYNVIYGYLKKYIKNILNDVIKIEGDYNLLFNISNKETSETIKDEFRTLENLSLGQQVAAILTFVINYGKFVNDNSPLIIDQPEDNLDNQYIYKNLVDSLKSIKNERQVIIATHSSTIVTNADSEQVIVMDSDNRNGWIKKKGYASDKDILKHIVNYMEGGIESFNHKINIYSEVLKKK